MTSRPMSSIITVLCLVLGVFPFEDGRAADYSRQDPLQRAGNADSNSASKPVQLLWEEPTDIETRDLFYGIGGREGAPDPSGKFTFVRREGAPDDTSEKIIVEDDRGRTWTVKFGWEAGPETTASRLVWAAGYHTDQDYFVSRAHIHGRGGFDVWDVRFERDDDGFKKVGRWDWNSNPFVGTRELDGLKTLMALLNNPDVRTDNNKIVHPKKKSADARKHIYYVNDLGATFGSTGLWFSNLPILSLLAADTKGVVEDYVRHGFIEGTRNGEVIFHTKRRMAKEALKGVKIGNARWMGNLLRRLSNRQLTDAFRAGGFDELEVTTYVREVHDRIRQLRELGQASR